MSERLQSERLEYDGDLTPVFRAVAHDFDLGDVTGYKVVDVGYEDFNVIIDAEKSRHFVKIFSKDRSDDEIDRYAQVVDAALANGVRHPEIYEYQSKRIYREPSSGLKMAVMQYVDGITFFEDNKRTLSDDELSQVLEQAVLISKTPLKPTFLEDSWAIQHTSKWYEEIKAQLEHSDQLLIERALADFESVDVDHLPHSLVHGDLIKSNLMVGKDGKIYVLDFSVANWYPRVQELAVIAANLMNDGDSSTDFNLLIEKIVNIYKGHGGALTQEEIDVLPVVTRLAYAAELVGALKEELLNGNDTDENKYWLKMGRIGLTNSFNVN